MHSSPSQFNLLRLALLVVAIGSFLLSVRQGFGLTFHLYLNELLNGLDAVVGAAVLVFEPVIRWVIKAIGEYLAIDLVLQPHWKHVFVVIWLLVGSHANASNRESGVGYLSSRSAWAFLCSLAAAGFAGAYPFSHPAILLLPLAGISLYFAYDRRELFFVATAAAIAAIYFPVTTFIGSEWSNGFGLILLTAFLFLLAIWLIGSQRPVAEREMGNQISIVLVGSAVVLIGNHFLAHPTANSGSNDRTSDTETGQQLQDCATCPKMVLLPAGSFMMGIDGNDVANLEKLYPNYPKFLDNHGERIASGNQAPKHRVTVRSIFMSATEVTLEQFSMFVRESGYKLDGHCWGAKDNESGIISSFNWSNPGFGQDANHPVVCVNWYDAVAYTNWLSRRTNQTYRLPTEAEWEYAAKAGGDTLRYWGSDIDACEHANSSDMTAAKRKNAAPPVFKCDDAFSYTAPVGSLRPNKFGLYDMLGNVYEWTADCMAPNYQTTPTDGSAYVIDRCDLRISRGGSYDTFYPWLVTTTSRYGVTSPVWRNIDGGFRVVREK